MRKLLFAAVAMAALCGAAHAQQIVYPGPVPTQTPSQAVEATHVFKAAPGTLYGFQVNTGASPVWVLLFDAPSPPADGAVTPLKVYQVAGASTGTASWTPIGLQFFNGMSAACSTTGPFTKTASATCTFSGEVK